MGLASERLYIQPGTAADLLRILHQRELIMLVDPTAPAHEYGPTRGDLVRLVEDLAVAYAKQLVAVTNLIHPKSTGNVQGFADAFLVQPGLGFESMNLFPLGLVAMGCFAAGLFFLRFWRETKDRLFLAFAVSSSKESTERSGLSRQRPRKELRSSTSCASRHSSSSWSPWSTRIVRPVRLRPPPPSVREVPSSDAGVAEN